MMTVANTIDERISSVASRTIVRRGLSLGFWLGAVLAQPSHHVLDIDDRVVDQVADGDRHAAQASWC